MRRVVPTRLAKFPRRIHFRFTRRALPRVVKRLRRWTIRLLAVAAVLLLIALAAIGWLGSSHLLSPERRLLQDYHHQILDHPPDTYATCARFMLQIME